MADKVRFAPGGARPSAGPLNAQTVSATRSELFPGVDRPTMVLWLGVGLLIASEVLDYGPIATVFEAAMGKTPKSNNLGLTELAMEVGLLAFLYVLALASDNSGTVAVLIVVALWVAWLVRHANAVVGFLAPAANANTQQAKGN